MTWLTCNINFNLCTQITFITAFSYLPCSDLDQSQKIIIYDGNMDLFFFNAIKVSEFTFDTILVVELLHSKNWDDIISSKKCLESTGNNTGAVDAESKYVVEVVKLKLWKQAVKFFSVILKS